MRLEAVIVCVNYADFLAHTLPENLQHLDHVVVVTSHDDKATKDVCNHLGITCVVSDAHIEHGDKFNKGRLINSGLAHCRLDDWVLQMDADVVLPHRFRATFNMAKCEPDKIYGVDRLMVHGFDEWNAAQPKLIPQFKDGCHVIPHGDFEMGSRLLHGDYGYCPIGYFQLWHASQKKQYPGSTGSAEHSDVVFAMSWPRIKRVLLPQMFVYHLDAHAGQPMGANWNGRKTSAFCPCHDYFLPEHLKYHHRHHPRHRHHRHHRHHHHPIPIPPYKPCEDKK